MLRQILSKLRERTIKNQVWFYYVHFYLSINITIIFVCLSMYLNTKLDYWDEFHFLLCVFYVKMWLPLSVLNFCRVRCMHVLTQMQRNQSQVQHQLKTLVCVNSLWMQIRISNIHGLHSLRSPGRRASENDWEVIFFVVVIWKGLYTLDSPNPCALGLALHKYRKRLRNTHRHALICCLVDVLVASTSCYSTSLKW